MRNRRKDNTICSHLTAGTKGGSRRRTLQKDAVGVSESDRVRVDGIVRLIEVTNSFAYLGGAMIESMRIGSEERDELFGEKTPRKGANFLLRLLRETIRVDLQFDFVAIQDGEDRGGTREKIVAFDVSDHGTIFGKFEEAFDANADRFRVNIARKFEKDAVSPRKGLVTAKIESANDRRNEFRIAEDFHPWMNGDVDSLGGDLGLKLREMFGIFRSGAPAMGGTEDVGDALVAQETQNFQGFVDSARSVVETKERVGMKIDDASRGTAIVLT